MLAILTSPSIERNVLVFQFKTGELAFFIRNKATWTHNSTCNKATWTHNSTCNKATWIHNSTCNKATWTHNSTCNADLVLPFPSVPPEC